MGESPLSFDAEIADQQVILRALEQREAELYWDAHESRHPSRPGDDVPDGKVYDSMDALVADLGAGE
jgi:hypothetical protein